MIQLVIHPVQVDAMEVAPENAQQPVVFPVRVDARERVRRSVRIIAAIPVKMLVLVVAREPVQQIAKQKLIQVLLASCGNGVSLSIAAIRLY